MQTQEQFDLPDVEDFFRRGDEYSATASSLVPPMGRDIGWELSQERGLDDSILRTPEQLARRQKFIRYVSTSMGGLVIAMVLVFVSEVRTLNPGDASHALALAAKPHDSSDAEPGHALLPHAAVADKSNLGGVALPVSTQRVLADLPPAKTDESVTALTKDAPVNEPTSVPVLGTPAKSKSISESRAATVVNSDDKPRTVVRPVARIAAANSLQPARSSGVRASANRRPSVQAVSPLAEPTAQIKPADYKPPTASFSD